MIRNDEALAVVREQLALIEHALAALRRRVKNERNFQLYSEGYVDQIADLKADIKKYSKAAKKNGVSRAKNGRGRSRQKI